MRMLNKLDICFNSSLGINFVLRNDDNKFNCSSSNKPDERKAVNKHDSLITSPRL